MTDRNIPSKHRTLFENWWTIERNESVRHGLIWRIAGEAFEAGFKAAQQVETSAPPRSFQDRVFDWARDCFGERDTTDPTMRTFRFLEEALELAQACGCDRAAAERVLAYVYGRPPGVVAQEVGGTMVSLAVLCQALRLGMSRCAEDELARVLGKVEQIRARHAAKPDFSSPADETPCSVRPHDFCSAGTCAVCTDAGRYRWLRDGSAGSNTVHYELCQDIANYNYGADDFDKKIDAAMAEQLKATVPRHHCGCSIDGSRLCLVQAARIEKQEPLT